ncbi:uncharacterized protein BROUX77_003221 [Berkeleyomyces rouxiae]|uniref:uncharacterized protein n=1 Tax=Berkeleyomyces rouxiae TaxID=2035830 RepID=UPI003B82233E
MPLSLSSIVATTLTASNIVSGLPPLKGRFPGLDSTSSIDSPGLKNFHSIKEIRATHANQDGQAALAKIYEKYRVRVPQDLDSALARRRKRDTFSTPLQYTTQDVAQISAKVGVSQEKVNLILDTSSSGVWLLSEEAVNSEFQKPYVPEKSFSAERMEGYTWEMEHLNGRTAFGDVYQDMVSIDTVGYSLTSYNQAVQLAIAASRFWNLKDVSGVMGMAFSSRNAITPEPQPNFFDNVVEKLDEKVFTVDMKHLATGAVEFGHVDSNKYAGNIGYTEVFNQDGYWNFTLGGLINDATSPFSGVEYAIADTSSSLMLLPMQYNMAYYKQISDSEYSSKHGGFIFPCDTTMPDFAFVVGDVELVIPGSYIEFSVLDDDSDLCFGGLQPSDNLGLNIVGSIAFNSAFVVFRPIDAKIGWATKSL